MRGAALRRRSVDALTFFVMAAATVVALPKGKIREAAKQRSDLKEIEEVPQAIKLLEEAYENTPLPVEVALETSDSQ